MAEVNRSQHSSLQALALALRLRRSSLLVVALQLPPLALALPPLLPGSLSVRASWQGVRPSARAGLEAEI